MLMYFPPRLVLDGFSEYFRSPKISMAAISIPARSWATTL
jgi:hypothetical protein